MLRKFLFALSGTSFPFSLFVLRISICSIVSSDPNSSQHQHQHHTPSSIAEAQPIHPHPLHCRSFTRRLISDPSPNPFTDSPSPSTNLIRPIPKSLYRPISKSLYRFTLTLNRFNQTHLQIPLPIHPHRVTHLFKPTLKGFWVWVTLHSITLSSNRHSRVLDFCFSVCVSFLSLQEKERFSLCLCLVFDQRFVVDVCRGEIQLHHGGFSLSGMGLARSESLHTRFSLSSSIPVSFSLRFPSV